MPEQAENKTQSEEIVLITVEGKEHDLFSISFAKHPLLKKVKIFDRLALRAKVDNPYEIAVFENFVEEESTSEDIILLDGIYKIIGIHPNKEDRYIPYLIETNRLPFNFFQNSAFRIHLIREFSLHSDLEALNAEVLFSRHTA